jgi:hypothetical protein
VGQREQKFLKNDFFCKKNHFSKFFAPSESYYFLFFLELHAIALFFEYNYAVTSVAFTRRNDKFLMQNRHLFQ